MANVRSVITRRQFVKAAVLAGAAAAVPPVFDSFFQSARAATGASTTAYFLTPTRWATCQALCARIVPTGTDPATDPGATEADAVVFVDRFLSAFELPSSVADNPAIWVRGPNSGRNPYLGEGGEPSDDYPTDDFLGRNGVGSFLAMTPAQELSWRYQLYGSSAVASVPAFAKTWASQLGTLIPSSSGTGGLRQAYADGLDAFDSYSQSVFGTPFASASSEEQDLMLAVAGNLVVSSLPTSLPSPPAAPAAATALVPFITLHTFQATYGIPEYSWRNQYNDPTVIPLQGTAQWREISYDGDTQPLGNSLFDAEMYGPGEGPNAGFGAAPGSADADAGVFVPFGGYREFRPVSTLAEGGIALSAATAEQIKQMFEQGGIKTK